jgi:4-hydroxybenzoyl-CoA thioesterase
MTFEQEKLVRFQHCDMAGIVFYPRYFELLDEVIEDWLQGQLGWPATNPEALHIADAQISFQRPSLLGERLNFSLQLEAVEADFIALGVRVSGGGETRFEGRLKLQCIAEMQPVSLPTPLRQALAAVV